MYELQTYHISSPREEIMFKRSLLGSIVSMSLSLLLSACVGSALTSGNTLVGSGKHATRDYALGGFTGIWADGGFRVIVTGGDAFKVLVTADDNLLDVVDVKKEGSILVVGLVSGRSVNTTRLEAAVTLPTLEAVNLNGGSTFTVTGNLPKSSSLMVNGNGGSRADLGSLVVDKVSVTLNGGARATVNVRTRLDYDLNGGAQLRYTGNPMVGSGKVDGGAQAIKY
jgi:hypothetical protein